MDTNFKGDPRAYQIAQIVDDYGSDTLDSCVAAAIEYMRRKDRKTHPPGTFDSVGRFYADERTKAVLSCRSPSRAWPFPEMKAARTVAHVAEVFEVEDFATEIRQLVNFASARCAVRRDLRRLIVETLKFLAENPRRSRKPKPFATAPEADAQPAA